MSSGDVHNLGRFNLWVLAWVAAFGVAAVTLKRGWVEPLWVKTIVASVPAGVGLFALNAYRRFLRETDEMQRRIQLDGMALGFGVGILFSYGYRLFERIGAPALDVSDPVLVFVAFWALGQWLATRRYA